MKHLTVQIMNRWALILVGVIFGLISIIIFNLPFRWVIAYLSIIPLAAAAFYTGNIKLFCLGLFIFAIPLNVQDTLWSFPDHEIIINGEHISPAHSESLGIFLSDIPLVILYFIWFFDIAIKKRNKVRFPETSIPFVLFLIWCLLTFIKSESLVLSFLSYISFLKYFLIFLYIANNIRTEKEVQIVVGMLILGAVVQGVITLIQWKLGISVNVLGKSLVSEGDQYLLYRTENEFFRGTGTVGISNVQAMYFVSQLP